MSVHYDPAAVGKLRMHVTMRASLEQLKLMGFTEKDTDDVRRANRHCVLESKLSFYRACNGLNYDITCS